MPAKRKRRATELQEAKKLITLFTSLAWQFQGRVWLNGLKTFNEGCHFDEYALQLEKGKTVHICNFKEEIEVSVNKCTVVGPSLTFRVKKAEDPEAFFVEGMGSNFELGCLCVDFCEDWEMTGIGEKCEVPTREVYRGPRRQEVLQQLG